jgi:hypothetical protein
MVIQQPRYKNYFTTRWPSRCYNCGLKIEEGERAFYVSDRDNIYGGGCCDILPLEELLRPVIADSEHEEERIHTVPVDRVMPRGRKVTDACSICFQIPSSNGGCGCDY